MIEDRLAAAGLPALPRRAWLEIDVDALTSNLRAVRSLADPGAKVAAVVKADGYGHGIEVSGRTFAAAGAELLCVASLDEAMSLRRVGIAGRILVLFAIPPSELDTAVESGVELVAADEELARELLSAWSDRGDARPDHELRLHLEVETGLGRAGVEPGRVVELASSVRHSPGARLAGIWSHLASPDDPGVTAAQEEQMRIATEALAAAGIDVPPVHLSASGGLFTGTGVREQMVRPGLCLYGELADDLPLAEPARTVARGLRAAMTLKARALRLTDVRPGASVGYGGRWTASRRSRIATLPVGYGDGWTRTYQPGSEALVRGRRVPLVGTVAMDAVAADVTDVPGVDLADEFVLLGAQGDDRITASELARRRNTISWEVLVTMAKRLPRVYHAASGLTGVRTLGGESLVGGDASVPGIAREAAGAVDVPASETGSTEQARHETPPAPSSGSGRQRREAVG
jgi:alanine racemase